MKGFKKSVWRLTGTGFVLSVFILFAAIAVAGEKDPTMKEVKKETRQALEVIQEYSAEQRDETLRKAESLIHELDADIERLENKMDRKWDDMDKEAQKKTRATLKTIRKQRNKMAEWYGGMQHSSAKAWEDVKNGFIKSYKVLEDSFKSAVKKF